MRKAFPPEMITCHALPILRKGINYEDTIPYPCGYAHLPVIVGDGLFSMLFFWPRNTIMFIEGTAVHSAAFLQQTAQEFQPLHWARLVFSAVESILIFTGFLKFYRYSLVSPDSLHPGSLN